MRRLIRGFVVAVTTALMLAMSGCSGPIPIEKVPDGWALDVHQPGEWWMQPLIPRSVIVQRCPPKPGWSSRPDLTKETALPPGSDVNYALWTDDYHCDIGWAQPRSEVSVTVAELATEAGLRRLCSSTGLPMDARWRFIGRQSEQTAGDLTQRSSPEDNQLTAAFINDAGAVVACKAGISVEPAVSYATVELSLGGPGQAVNGEPACPLRPSHKATSATSPMSEYQARGAGAVRGKDGRVLTEAATVELTAIGDTLATRHPVKSGIAIVNAVVAPVGAVPAVEWGTPPPMSGRILANDGTLLATCRG